MYNPAAVGAGGKFCLSALSHYQYTGFEDRTIEFFPSDPSIPSSKPGTATKSVGPKTKMFAFSAPLNFGTDAGGNIRNLGGLGIAFMDDKLGYENSTHIKIQGAGRLPFNDGGALAVGFEYNILQKGVNGKMLKPLAQGDPRIPTSTVTENHPNYAVGLYYNNPMTNSASIKDVWGGFSVSQLKYQQYYFGGPATPYAFSDTRKHYYVMGGFTMQDFLGKPDLELLPSVMIKQNTVVQFELSALARYQKKLWGGINYRSMVDAFSIMLGYQISNDKSKLNGLRIGYSYDLTLSKILSVSSGSHEIQLNYCFSISIPKPPIKRILNPRHLDRDPNLD
jgi:type IX secretion system PorP/SprF family membrane protein